MTTIGKMSAGQVAGWLLVIGACFWYANEARVLVIAFNELDRFAQVIGESADKRFEQPGSAPQQRVSEYKAGLKSRAAISSGLFAMWLGLGLFIAKKRKFQGNDSGNVHDDRSGT